MTRFISYLVWLINNLWASVLVVVVFAIILKLFQRSSRRKNKDESVPAPVILLLIVPLSMLFFFRHFITVPLIYHFGLETGGRVVTVESIPEMYNERQVYRHRVVFHNQQEDLIETSFKTSDFNVYPVANRASYPSTGDNFTLRYMQHTPSEFIIVKDDNEERLHKLRRERSALQETLNFDPNNADYLLELDKIEQEIQLIEQQVSSQNIPNFSDIPLASFISEISEVTGLYYSPAQDTVLIEMAYEGIDGNSEDGLIAVLLTSQSVTGFHPIQTFVNFIGISNDTFYTYDWGDNQLFGFSLDTFNQVADVPDEIDSSFGPIIVGDFLLDDDSSHPMNKVYNLTTNEENLLPHDAISLIVQHGAWHLITPDQQNNRIQTLLSLETLTDYQTYFTNVLADGAMILEHTHADSGLFHSNNDDEIDSMTYLKTVDIFFRSGAQSDFKESLPPNTAYEIIGIEDDGTVYGLVVEDGQMSGVKKDAEGDLKQIHLDIMLNSFEFESLHLEDSFIILTDEELIQISKEDFSTKQLLDLENII